MGGCKYSPDHGWAPPAKHPIHRTAATYSRWFPGKWTGTPSAADPNFRYSMVYTPTDTTQLGYSYQRVPVWQRHAGMIPPVPHPDEWHTPDYGVHYNGVVDAAAYGHHGGIVYSDGYVESGISSGPTPTDAQLGTEIRHGAESEPYVPAPSNPQQGLPPAEPGLAPVPEAPAADVAPPSPSARNAWEMERSAVVPQLQSIPQR